MSFPGAEKLLDFAQPFDVPMLDQIIGAFYTPGADPTMVRARSLSACRRCRATASPVPRTRRPCARATPDPRATLSRSPRPQIAKAVRDFSDRKRETPFLTLFSFPSLPLRSAPRLRR